MRPVWPQCETLSLYTEQQSLRYRSSTRSPYGALTQHRVTGSSHHQYTENSEKTKTKQTKNQVVPNAVISQHLLQVTSHSYPRLRQPSITFPVSPLNYDQALTGILRVPELTHPKMCLMPVPAALTPAFSTEANLQAESYQPNVLLAHSREAGCSPAATAAVAMPSINILWEHTIPNIFMHNHS